MAHDTERRPRRKHLGLLPLVALLIVLALVAAACGSDDSDSSDAADTPADVTPATVKMISWSTPRTEQANIFAAQDLGYFAEEKITFEYIPGQGSGDSLRQLLAGNGDIAFAGPEGVFLAAEQGAEIMAVYNTYPQNIFVLVTKKASGIDTVAKLKGKKIGVLSLASGGRYNTNTMLATADLKESDVTLIATGPSPAAFLAGQVDAFMTLSTSVGPLEAQGQQLNKFPVADVANLPTDVFVITKAAYDDKAKRAVIERFLRAIDKGTQYMIDNVDGAVAIGVKNGLDVKDPVAAKPIIVAFGAASQSAGTKDHGLGWFDMKELQAGADLYLESGLITKKQDVKKYFTNSLVDAIND